MPELTTVVIDCRDPEALAPFWSAILDAPVQGRWTGVVVVGSTPPLMLSHVDEVTPGKNRIHVHVEVDDEDAAVEQIIGLGGSLVSDVRMGPMRWLVCADPDGNQFCIGVHVEQSEVEGIVRSLSEE